LANNCVYAPIDFSTDHGLSAEPDWAMARWNNP
jgi:hypothetical protein